MTKDSKDTGTKSSSRPEFKRTPMKVLDESHPIFSNPTVITFGKNSTRSTRSLEKDSTESSEKPTKSSRILELLRSL